jgi:hypothetical protein
MIGLLSGVPNAQNESTSYEGMNKCARRREQRQLVRAGLLRTRQNNDFTPGIGSQLFPALVMGLWGSGQARRIVIKITRFACES